MAFASDRVPASLVLDPTLSPSAKLLSMVRWLHRDQDELELRSLVTLTALSAKTVRKGLAELDRAGHSPGPGAAPSQGATPAPDAVLASATGAQRNVTVPRALLADRRVGICGKLLYAQVQLTAEFRYPAGQLTYAGLRDFTQISLPALRRAIRELAEARWVHITQANQCAPFRLVVDHPDASRAAAEVERVRARLKDWSFRGEALMKEWLSLLIDSDQFEDNARPGFLVNPFTDERLEFDRFYPPHVGFEYNGPQHDGPTDIFSAEYATKQRGRDLIKHGICTTRGITLIVIRRQDLSLQTMQAKVGTLLPLRDLKGHERLIAYLQRVSRSHRLSKN